MNKKKLLFIVNVDWFFLSHRLPIAIEAINQGYEVHIATTISNELDSLKKNGLIVHPINLNRSRTGLLSVISEFKEILDIIRLIAPNIVHLVTIKPVLLGGIASRILNVPAVVYAVSGLGYVFLKKGVIAFIIRKIIIYLYQLSFRHKNKCVIFQNDSDQSTLTKLSLLSSNEVELINGSGVDLSVFTQQSFDSGVPVIILAARLLKDKGVKEFVEAAKLVNINNNRARFALVGEPDFDNPASIQRYELENWKNERIIELWGHREDMEKVIPLSTIVVLPSYREGFPKILIEAAACGRPVVTTDVPGCRDAIEKDITGIIVPVRDYIELAKKISFLLDNPTISRKMGNAGRLRAEEFFDINKVVEKHMKIYEDLLNRLLV